MKISSESEDKNFKTWGNPNLLSLSKSLTLNEISKFIFLKLIILFNCMNRFIIYSFNLLKSFIFLSKLKKY